MSLHNWNNKKIIVENTASYMVGQDFDIVEEVRGKKIADPLRAKLMGMEDIRALKGTMTPRYFATKVIRFLQKNNPELDISDLSDDDIQQAINVVAQVSKPLSQKPDVKITTRERGAAEGGLQRGDTGFETLKLNLGDNAILKSEGEVGENDLYTVVKDGLKYRVTLNKFKGQKLNLDDISQDDVVSVVVVKPSEMETVDKFAGEVELGQREKLVADYPEGEEETMDMDDVIDAVKKMSFDKNKLTADRYGRKHGISQGNVYDDVRQDPREVDPYMPDIEDAECPYSDEEIDTEKSDLNDDGEISEYEKSRGLSIAKAMENERKRAGQVHSRAVADHYEDAESSLENTSLEDLSILSPEEFETVQNFENFNPDEWGYNSLQKFYFRKRKGGEDEEFSTSQYMSKAPVEKREEAEEVKMSHQQINQYLAVQERQRIQNFYAQQRRNTHGY
jgi:hypothetical protein